MKHTLTALAAATLLTTAAYAGHSVHHSNPQPVNGPVVNTLVSHDNTLVSHDNKIVNNKFTSVNNNNKGSLTHPHRDKLRPQDCSDFRYCCWLPRCHSYCFWRPSDDCWYYWYAPGDCYLPYDQIETSPPQANVVPQILGGLPPVVAGGNPGPSDDAVPTPPPGGEDMGTP